MPGLLIGYARLSTDAHDLTAQRDGLEALGVAPERIYVDHGLTGTHRDRPGLRDVVGDECDVMQQYRSPASLFSSPQRARAAYAFGVREP